MFDRMFGKGRIVTISIRSTVGTGAMTDSDTWRGRYHFVIRCLTDDLSDAALQSQPREVISQAGAYLLGALAVLSTPSPDGR